MGKERKPPRLELAERSFRELLERAELPAPDEVLVEAEAEELVFLWNGPKVAIVVELGEENGQLDGRVAELIDQLESDLDADPGCVGTFEVHDEDTVLGDFGAFRVPPERLM